MEFQKKKNLCVYCHQYVRYNSQALECDICKQWVLRACRTYISISEFKDILRNINNGLPFEWECASCIALKEQPSAIRTAIRRLHTAEVRIIRICSKFMVADLFTCLRFI